LGRGDGGREGDMKDGERRKRGEKTVHQLLIMLQYLRLMKKQKNYRLCNLKALSLADFIRILIMCNNIVAKSKTRFKAVVVERLLT
jgi:hypothetical protein